MRQIDMTGEAEHPRRGDEDGRNQSVESEVNRHGFDTHHRKVAIRHQTRDEDHTPHDGHPLFGTALVKPRANGETIKTRPIS